MKAKKTDNYSAKIELWISRPKVFPLPGITGVPKFGSRKFDSYKEFNLWKKALLADIASCGGVRWKK